MRDKWVGHSTVVKVIQQPPETNTLTRVQPHNIYIYDYKKVDEDMLSALGGARFYAAQKYLKTLSCKPRFNSTNPLKYDHIKKKANAHG